MTNGDNAALDVGGSLDAADPASGELSRRTIMAGAAWSVPAIVAASASPAFAASSALLNLTTPNMAVPADGTVVVTANLKNSSGVNQGGKTVTFSLPTGATYSGTTTTKVTNSSGNATITIDFNDRWAKPGSTKTVSAISGSETRTQSFTVLGANLLAAGLSYTSSLAQAELEFPSPVVQAVASYDGSANSGQSQWFMVLLQTGTVWTLGYNGNGQLGDGTTTSRSTWAQVPNLTGVSQIAAGTGAAFALMSDGSVRAWGDNFASALGKGGARTNSSSSPVTVAGLSDVTQIAAGTWTGYALLSNGTVKAWGNGGVGQLGDGATSVRAAPALVSDGASGVLSDVTQVAAYFSGAYALLTDGTVRAWGDNSSGEVGDGTTSRRLAPVAVSGLTGVTQIAGGGGAGYALLSDKTVRAWGAGSNGQLGNGSTASQSTAVTVSGLTNVAQVSAGSYAAYARLTDGTVRAWGDASFGQLGNGSTTDNPTPTTPSPLQGQSVMGLVSGMWGRTLLVPTAV